MCRVRITSHPFQKAVVCLINMLSNSCEQWLSPCNILRRLRVIWKFAVVNELYKNHFWLLEKKRKSANKKTYFSPHSDLAILSGCFYSFYQYMLNKYLFSGYYDQTQFWKLEIDKTNSLLMVKSQDSCLYIFAWSLGSSRSTFNFF